MFVERSFENLHCRNLSKLMEESIQILMNENNKSFYRSDMFEFIHHPKYGCHDLKGLKNLFGFTFLKVYQEVEKLS
jgi:hypothetical protein